MLRQDPEAYRLHEAAIGARTRADYPTAHLYFGEAAATLPIVPTTTDQVVQLAHIVRDDGFTYVHDALASTAATPQDRVEIVKHGLSILVDSLELTTPLMSGTQLAPSELPQLHDTPKRPRREVFAEHGATLSALGRAATVQSVMLGMKPRRPTQAAANVLDQQAYGLAHDILRLGSNGYYRVSNAMVGARQERLNGRLPHTLVWLNRAAVGLAWTAMRDPGNLAAAYRTAASRVVDVRSRRAAMNAVFTKP
jgi:hypothetical protein